MDSKEAKDAKDAKDAKEDAIKDLLHWARQGIAIACGVAWGLSPVTGGIGIVGFLALSTALIWGYYTLVLKVDEEELGGHGALMQEGLFVSVGLFLLVWIVLYSCVHAT
eukprot:TRINITY_DN5118_c0_g1_i1.p2 TRINITY_DN5118_c0_g1~~TRINITY_DN5118_c0_g1_i1.p2  ORF type:complete len:109 (+),score=11.17 TRINITY_DN5118_c0_g1_i1:414-740(+)